MRIACTGRCDGPVSALVVPADASAYLHLSGRTSRRGRDGVADGSVYTARPPNGMDGCCSFVPAATAERGLVGVAKNALVRCAEGHSLCRVARCTASQHSAT